jgi:hypothetical protein
MFLKVFENVFSNVLVEIIGDTGLRHDGSLGCDSPR